jgi:small-conductance mechanosensitive channel
MLNLDDFIKHVTKISSKPLFTLSGTEVTLFSIFTFFLIIVFSIAVSLVMQRALKRALAHKFKKREGTLTALLRLIHYTVVIIGFGIGLQMVGINISALFAAGAVFAIAIGFAMQNIVQNFVSGIILMVERSIAPGDILEVEGVVVKVVEMGIRTTVVKTWKEEELIMPNSIISQSTVKNYTMGNNEFRLGAIVGVSYGSDMKKVMEVLETTARNMPWGLPEPEPKVLLQEFGDSAVVYGVYVSIDEPWRQKIYSSDLRKAIWFALKDANITIAFNQIDIHFDPPVADALTSLNKKNEEKGT